ncbi:MAG: thiamine phosphate synthase [Campylobacterota bacterium]|nr:thiamine phosphate synthase [Campylobacterota bacterium]
MIYALVDKETLLRNDLSLQDLLRHIATLQIPILQYRNKPGSLEEKQRDLEEIRGLYHGTLIINDSIELIDYADGLHLGQEDMKAYSDDKKKAVAMIRQKIAGKQLGLSTHNTVEIEEANDLEIDYIGLGAYRSTGTKKDAKVGGEALLKIAKLSRHPVAIIGGVRMDDSFEEPIVYKVIGSGLYDYQKCL